MALRMRTAACAALALLASACAAIPASPRVAPLPREARVEPSRFIVVTVRNAQRPRAQQAGSTPRGYDAVGAYGVTAAASDAVHALERQYRLQPVSAWPIATLHVHCIVFRLPPLAARATLIAQLVRDPRVESAQPLNEFTTEAGDADASAWPGHAAVQRPRWMPYDDPYAPLQHALRELDVVRAQRFARGEGVRIAIIDTGIDLTHPDLRGRIAVHRNFVNRDSGQFARDRHGTAVAGVIAAVVNNGIGIVGIAPAARLLAFKACWQPPADATHAVCNSFTLAQGLEAALLAHADIVNLSLAGPPDPLLERLVREGERQGMLFVGAVAADGPAHFPTDIPGVLAVESSANGLGHPGDLLAPGQDILTLTPGGHYDFASGSSLAAAQVSGVLALMISGGRRLSTGAARQILAASARARAAHDDTANERIVRDPPRGLIDACRALTAAVGHGACREGPGSLADVEDRASDAR